MANATHLRLRYDVASVLTLLLLLASQGPALADGGAGGNAYGGTGGAGGVGYSGQNGEDGGSFPSVGGGGGAAGGGSGGGNADGAAPGLGGTAGSRNGQAGGDQMFGAAGAGGGGGYNGNGAGAPWLSNSTTLVGGDGGRGGDTNNGGNAGGGGAGGYGAIATGAFLSTNSGFILGGTGGRGGITSNGGGAGSAGDGGVGILFTGASATLNNILSGFITGGSGGAGGNTTNGGPRGAGGDGGAGVVGNSLTITNAGTIRGGNGGMVGFGADQGATAGSGGAGIIGSGLNIQNTGVIQGGSNGGGGTANAITFTGGNNVLALSNTSDIIGNIGLVGQLELQQLTSDVVLSSAITGTGFVTKTGTTTLTLTGENTFNGTTTIAQGTLQIGDGGTSGSLFSNIINNGSLVFNRSDTPTYAGVISGPGSVTKLGVGTLTLTGANVYTGGTTILTGTLEVQNAGALGSGGVTLNGGHLRSNIAGTATLANPLSLVNGSLISAAPGQTLNINLANVANGAIVLLGSASDTGTLVTTGAAIATAGSSTVEINGGTVRAGSAQLSGLLGSATRLTLANNATLDLAGFGASIRDLWGTGTLTGSGGSLQIAGGDFAGSVSGAVAVEKVSADPLNLDGISTYTGPTTVRAGYLGVNGSLVSTVSVLNDAALGGSGTIGGLNVQSGGFVIPGNSIGTLNVNGNVSFAPGSVYALEINGAGQSDRIAATGTATLNGGTVMILPDQGVNFVENTPYTILTAQGGVTGQFAATQSAEFAFVSPTLGYATNAVTLTMVRKTEPTPPGPTPPTPTPPTPPAPLAFHSVAVSENQYRTADAIEALRPGNRLYNTVLSASVSGARQAFDALSGEAHASAVTTGYEQAQLIQTALLNRLREPLLASSLPLLAQGRYAAAFAADRPGQAVAPVAVAPVPVAPRYALWGEGFGSWGQTRANGNAAALDATTGGFVLGADALVFDGIRLGLAGGYLSTSFDVDARLSSGTTDSIFGALYGSGQWGNLNLRLGAVVARQDFDVRRTIAFPGYADATRSSSDGSSLQGFGELGYRFGLGQFALEPFAGASVLRLSTDRFQESGGAAALSGAGRTYDLGTTTLGVRAESQLSAEVPLTLKGLVGWRHAYGDVEPQALLAFAGGTLPFAVSGVPVDRDALIAEAGLAWQASQAISLGVNYAGQIGQRAQEHSLKGNFTWQF